MAKIKQEGTFLLDGLIEGPIFAPEDHKNLELMLSRARTHGIVMHLSADGGRFSLLPDRDPIQLGHDLTAKSIVVNLLENWLSGYDPRESGQIMSTLRSVEYVPGEELQVLYGIAPNGKIHTEQRSVQCQTVPPPKPLDPRVVKKMVIYGVVSALVCILISTLFVPYRELGRRFWNNIKPYDTSQLRVDCGYQEILQVQSVEYDKKDAALAIEFQVPADLLLSADLLADRWQKDECGLKEKLALEAIYKKQVICDSYNHEGQFISRLYCRLVVDNSATGQCHIRIPFNRAIAKIELY